MKTLSLYFICLCEYRHTSLSMCVSLPHIRGSGLKPTPVLAVKKSFTVSWTRTLPSMCVGKSSNTNKDPDFNFQYDMIKVDPRPHV